MNYAANVCGSLLLLRQGAGYCSSSSPAVRGAANMLTTTSIWTKHGPGLCSCRQGKCREVPKSFDTGRDENTRGYCFSGFDYLRGRSRVRRTHSIVQLRQGQADRLPQCFVVFTRSLASAATVPRHNIADGPEPLRPDSDASLVSKMRLLLKSLSGQCKVEELWGIYEELGKRPGLVQISNGELLLLCRRISECDESISLADGVVAKSVLWGSRLQAVLDELKRRAVAHNLSEERQLNLFAVIACALTGSSRSAAVQTIELIQAGAISKPNFAKRHVLLSFMRHSSPSSALGFFVDQALALDQRHPSMCKYFGYIAGPFWDILVAVTKKMVDPAGELRRQSRRSDKRRFALLGTIIMDALCENGMARSAYAVLLELKFHGVSVPYTHLHILVRELARERLFDHARRLYASLTPNKKSSSQEIRSYDGAGLCIAAHQGLDVEAQTIFSRLHERGQVRDEDISLLMHASAVKGDTKHVLELFDTFFTKRRTSLRSRLPNLLFMKPSLHHYTIVAFAFASKCNSEMMIEWLKRLERSGLKPDIAVYNIILKCYALNGDVSGLTEVLSQMSQAGIRPNVVSYTIIMAYLARRRDITAVEAMYRRMLREGVRPDSKLLNTVLNAHVEAGSWQGVIRTFDYLLRSTGARFDFGIDLYNVLLKAYVQIGAPLDMVLNVYQRLNALHIEPTTYTFACLIKSALQARRMDIAARLFVKMDRMSRNGGSTTRPSPHIFTMIMEGFLRHQHWESAHAVFDDMVERGLKPTSYTFQSIVASYARSDLGDDQLLELENFVRAVTGTADGVLRIRPWLRQFGGSNHNALGALYAPIIKAYRDRLRVDDAERLFSELSSSEEQPSIGTRTLILDVYRRSGNIEGVRRVWSEVFELALNYTNEIDKLLEAEEKERASEIQRNPCLLCVPLSIYIDALSHSGQHLEIARTWEAVRAAGFQFDAYNWNHLTVALLRAGEPLRAFQIVERVIIPYQKQAQFVLRLRSQPSSSPFLSDDAQVLAEMASEPPVQPRPGSFVRRARAAKKHRDMYEQDIKDRSSDLAHGLHILQQVTPSWGSWRPHAYTLCSLAEIFTELRSGKMISGLAQDTPVREEASSGKNAVVPKEPTPSSSSVEGNFLSTQDASLAKLHHSRQMQAAKHTLAWLRREFPMTARAVYLYNRRALQQTERSKKIKKAKHRRRRRRVRERARGKLSSRSPSIRLSTKVRRLRQQAQWLEKLHMWMPELARANAQSGNAVENKGKERTTGN